MIVILTLVSSTGFDSIATAVGAGEVAVSLGMSVMVGEGVKVRVAVEVGGAVLVADGGD